MWYNIYMIEERVDDIERQLEAIENILEILVDQMKNLTNVVNQLSVKKVLNDLTGS